MVPQTGQTNSSHTQLLRWLLSFALLATCAEHSLPESMSVPADPRVVLAANLSLSTPACTWPSLLAASWGLAHGISMPAKEVYCTTACSTKHEPLPPRHPEQQRPCATCLSIVFGVPSKGTVQVQATECDPC